MTNVIDYAPAALEEAERLRQESRRRWQTTVDETVSKGVTQILSSGWGEEKLELSFELERIDLDRFEVVIGGLKSNRRLVATKLAAKEGEFGAIRDRLAYPGENRFTKISMSVEYTGILGKFRSPKEIFTLTDLDGHVLRR